MPAGILLKLFSRRVCESLLTIKKEEKRECGRLSIRKTLKVYGYVITKCVTTIPKQRKIAKKINVVQQKKEAFEFAKTVSKRTLEMLNIPLTVSGLENIPMDRPVLFVSNHQGNFDSLGLIATSPIPISFISKKEVRKVPIIRTWMSLMGCLFIDRKKGKSSAIAIRKTFQQIKEKEAFVIYPEGTRSKNDTMNPFKKGGLRIAYDTKITVVPVTISGSYRIMEANKWTLSPFPLSITYHPMVTPSTEMFEEYLTHIYSTILTALPTTKHK